MPSETRVTDTDVAELVARMAEAADAYVRGDIDHYLDLFDHGDDYTLMPPYGGDTGHGVVDTEEARAATRAFFTGGSATLEVEGTYASGDLVVLVVVERQHAQVGGLPDQDWSLRVTLVFRRVGDRWRMVHRHADPLVHAIPFARCAELARGDDAGSTWAAT